MCCSVNGSVCVVCCVFDSVCELFGETIRNVFGGWRFSVGEGALLNKLCMDFETICVLCLGCCCCCLIIPLTLVVEGSLIIPLLVHQLAYPSIWAAAPSRSVHSVHLNVPSI